MLKRHFILSTIALLTAHSIASAQNAPVKEFKIGYQRNGILYLAKETGQLEKVFREKGIAIKWVEFSFGPPLLEALNLGSVDFGTTGDAPPIFAQAAGANLLYVAAQEAAGSGSALLVKRDSPIQNLEDLRGKKVGFSKASSAHNLTIAALEKAKLTYQDITPVYLAPADGAAAFAKGAIDAWTIWDPYFAVAEALPDTRVLAPAKGIVAQNSYFLANATFTREHPEVIALANAALAQTGQWAESHRPEVAKVFSEATGIALEAQSKAVARTDFKIGPINDATIREQQAIADRFLSLGLIPKQISVKDIVWNWKPAS